MTSRERNMLITLGVVALVGLLVFIFVLGGDDAGEETAPTLPASSPPAIQATPGTGVGEPTDEPPRAVTFFGGRDPFVPLIVDSPAPPDGSPGPNGSPLPTTSPPPDGGTDGTDGTNGDPTNGDGIAVTGRPVVLVDVLDDSSVQVEVEGDPLTVTEGQRFARSYQVLSVEANCARFLYGDESFTLCEGQPPK